MGVRLAAQGSPLSGGGDGPGDTHLSLTWLLRPRNASSPALNHKFAVFAFFCPPLLLWQHRGFVSGGFFFIF
jgi:hypothetical protein